MEDDVYYFYDQMQDWVRHLIGTYMEDNSEESLKAALELVASDFGYYGTGDPFTDERKYSCLGFLVDDAYDEWEAGRLTPGGDPDGGPYEYPPEVQVFQSEIAVDFVDDDGTVHTEDFPNAI